MVDFQVVHLDKSERIAPDFMKVGQGGDVPGPNFIGGSPIQRGR